MALRFIDGCDHYATADIVKKWTAAPTATIVAAGGRFGGNTLRVNDVATGYVRKTLDNQQTWIVGFAINPGAFPSTNTPIFQVLDQGNTQVELRVYNDGTLGLTRNGTSLSGGLSTFALSVGAWYFIEVKVTIAASILADEAVVKVNNTEVINVTAGQSTKATANSYANSLQFSGTVTATSLDDFYICDATGGLNDDFLGDSRIYLMLPNGAGDLTQFSLAGASNNWGAVDDNPPDNDTTYVYSQTPGQKDLYNLENLSISGATILGVQTVLDCRKDDTGDRQVAATIKTGGVVYDGVAFRPGTTYQFFTEVREINPQTAIAWIPSDLTSLQAGVKCVS